jgi:hypothetical protein
VIIEKICNRAHTHAHSRQKLLSFYIFSFALILEVKTMTVDFFLISLPSLYAFAFYLPFK